MPRVTKSNTISTALKNYCKYLEKKDVDKIANETGVSYAQVRHVIRQASYNSEVEKLLIPIAIKRFNEKFSEMKEINKQKVK